uniref:Threonine synthase n=1 Tax=Chromera velia CCMP2878 TaxID=1169474 RepID=A0A0G4FJY7_9ALVE|mmetsp:Transcript_3250/g.6725  ORF Transcript_3250/g.6725 Transcript_3250/m.6725 type:complete len:526 (+) Transcript_3250:172-1749(+)|eukprot:Cvel_3432.t1-p1 / transcript=Cvel_3432.t1 / gene=Cvel_3432 / organism=Chromera_velia_CCMP2878 / gene_product=Threonine synthase, putative / transcript_product=Threonine synthase, putative / location=Cvel_scaffold138:45179-51291(+) / protein_length=525 / sequence_SO=supercontig / SO=protein_coding / is_pseudo=false
MKYKSTRGGTTGMSFVDAVLTGLAEDGGLLMPESVPVVSKAEMKAWRSLRYQDLCFNIMRKFINVEEVGDADLKDIIERSYKTFRDPQITPVVDFVDDMHLLELFHGPTFAFKDCALQFLGNMFDWILEKRDQRTVILGATSGDTGSAAIAGFQGKRRADCVILYPLGRTSHIQELQMTTVPDENVQCVAIKGSFDDCQNIVKALFGSPLKKKLSLGAVNSINWARILAQIVYYWFAAFRVADRTKRQSLDGFEADFCVPTGNFGNILAGYYARKMGAPIGALVIASNSNNILTRFHKSGEYKISTVTPTMSPSMDIQISSNFERFMFDALGEDPKTTRAMFSALKNEGAFKATGGALDATREKFAAFCADEAETSEGIKEVFGKIGMVIEPHTAVGFICARKFWSEFPDRKAIPLVCLATAHVGKFADNVEPLLGKEAVEKEIPIELESLKGKKKRYEVLGPSDSRVGLLLRERFDPDFKGLGAVVEKTKAVVTDSLSSPKFWAIAVAGLVASALAVRHRSLRR